MGQLCKARAVNGVVFTNVDIAGVFGIFDGVNVRNIGEVFILGRGGHIHPAEFFGLLRGLAGELARTQASLPERFSGRIRAAWMGPR